MLLPISWLKKYVEVNETPQEVAQRFVDLGFEAEGIEHDVVDLDITPNRGDVLSMLGLAREYGASTKQPVNMPEKATLTYAASLPNFTITADPKTYHRICAIIINNIAVGPSPEWLAQAVTSAGMNSINNVVDLTNFVMLELGVPSHAFDLDELTDKQFTIRLSRIGEKFTSLKDEVAELPADAIVVENNSQIIDLLGIRGGASTMIQPKTKNVLIWTTSLPRPLIRRTSKLVNIRTESSYRQEREVDPAMVSVALERLAHLAQETIGGKASQSLDLYPNPIETKVITLDPDYVNTVLGTTISQEEVDSCLSRVGFKVKDNSVAVPSWRYFDINFPEDLVEEVARIYGYNRIPRHAITKNQKVSSKGYELQKALRNFLVSKGFTEVYTESFSGQEVDEELNGTESLAILANPVNRDFRYCRPSLTPHLINILARNAWSDDAKIFELGTVFPTRDIEENHLAVAGYGNLKKLFADWFSEDKIRIISPEDTLAKKYKLRRPITVVEILMSEFQQTIDTTPSTHADKPKYRPVSPFPPAVRDISIIVGVDVKPEEIMNNIYEAAGDNVVLVELFDQFSSDKFGPNKQSLAFHIVYQATNRTLENNEVDQIHDKIIQLIKETYTATIR